MCLAGSSRGFTLVELIVVMAIFMGIIIISSEAFNRIVSVSGQQSTSAESDTQGVIGLEIMRTDLEHAGYGLPWLLGFAGDFQEIDEDTVFGWIAPGIDSVALNAADPNGTNPDTNKVPRPVEAAASTTDGRDYLVIRSVLAGIGETTRRWSYVEGVGATSALKVWNSAEDLQVDDRVVTLDSRTKRLIGTGTTDFSYTINAVPMTPPDGTANATPTANYRPQSDSDMYVVYGISSASDLRTPFNRVDYFIKRPSQAKDIPARCAPGTGILYKGVMSHDGGGLTRYPLLECVADMQVAFTVAADGQNGVDVGQDGLSNLSARDIRQQLKAIKVYLLVHEGGKDRNYTYPSQTIQVGEGTGRTVDLATMFGPDYRHYRWKIYKQTVIPKNINY